MIKVSDTLKVLYARDWTVKPSGDTDVIEKQALINTMQQSWPIMQNTPAAQAFLSDLLEKMFPDSAQKYIKVFNDANAQQQSAQVQQMQQLTAMLQQMSAEIIDLSKHPEFFSDTGRIHAYPVIQKAATQMEQAQQNQPKPQQLTQGQQ